MRPLEIPDRLAISHPDHSLQHNPAPTGSIELFDPLDPGTGFGAGVLEEKPGSRGVLMGCGAGGGSTGGVGMGNRGVSTRGTDDDRGDLVECRGPDCTGK